jgi:hypothetical protein
MAGHYKHADNVDAKVMISVDHLLHTSRRAMHKFIGKEYGERLITNDVARAPDGVSKTQWFLLPNIHAVAGCQA